MRRTSLARAREQQGQILVIVAAGMIALIAATGLVVDVGSAYSSQRATQNAADSAANSGAVVLAERLGGASAPVNGGWDAEVERRVDASATTNGLASYTAVYSDISGNLLRTDGTITTDIAQAAVVGGGIPANGAGVSVAGTRNASTYFARVVGINSFSTTADATAVSGILASGPKGGVLPITFPVVVSTCDGQSDLIPGRDVWKLLGTSQAENDNMAIVPLCTTSAGSVGFLDLGGGNLADQITNPTNRSFPLPTWLQTQPGDVNSLEGELNQYVGSVILIPMFDGTCKVEPAGSNLADCPPGHEGVGNNSWYHIPQFTGFLLKEAYVQGSDRAACNSEPGGPFVGGNGSISCMKGWFVRRYETGPVIPGALNPSDPSAVGVQLIK